MKKYLFLIAWVEGSETLEDLNYFGDANTYVHSKDDLKKQYDKKNENIFSVQIEAPNEQIAEAIGYKEAFFEEYAANDSVSVLIEVNELIPNNEEVFIRVEV